MNRDSNKVLVIDDEHQIRRLLRMTLEDAGCNVVEAPDGESGLSQTVVEQPHLIILDLGLPTMSGVEVINDLRRWSDIPVLVLSIFSEEKNKIEALDAGADDYLTKPFSTGELLARMRALQRRIKAVSTNLFSFGVVEVDLPNRRVSKAGALVKLTSMEFSLLEIFITHRGKMLTHRFILSTLWGARAIVKTHYLRTYVLRLRRKLEDNPETPKFFVTESGIGYRFFPEDGS
jgi:two-component system KDP operon response regulator KdpE